MGHPDHQQSSSGGTIIAVVAVIALLLFGGLVVLGVGTWFFMRVEVSKNEVRARDAMQAERAQAMAERARAEALAAELEAKAQAAEAEVFGRAARNEAAASDEIEAMADRVSAEQAGTRRRADNDRESTLPVVKTKEILVQVDESGALQVDDRQVDREKLKTILQQAVGDSHSVVKVRLCVDPQCKFGDVADIQSLCREEGVSEITFATTGE